jgi:hypothetical protein
VFADIGPEVRALPPWPFTSPDGYVVEVLATYGGRRLQLQLEGEAQDTLNPVVTINGTVYALTWWEPTRRYITTQIAGLRNTAKTTTYQVNNVDIQWA